MGRDFTLLYSVSRVEARGVLRAYDSCDLKPSEIINMSDMTIILNNS